MHAVHTSKSTYCIRVLKMLFQFLFQWLVIQVVSGHTTEDTVPYGLPLLYPYGRCTQEINIQTMNFYLTPALLESDKPIIASVRPGRLDGTLAAGPAKSAMIPVTNFTTVPLLQNDTKATCYNQCLKYYCGENTSSSQVCSSNKIKSLSSLSLKTIENPQVLLSMVQREPGFIRVLPLIPQSLKPETTYTYYTLYGSSIPKRSFTVPTLGIMQVSEKSAANVTVNGTPHIYKKGVLLSSGKGDWWTLDLWDVVWLEDTQREAKRSSLTKITTTKPLVVFTGMARENDTYFSHVIAHAHQMPHTGKWGRTFIADVSHVRMLHDERHTIVSFKILASVSSTVSLTTYPDQNTRTFEIKAETVHVVTLANSEESTFPTHVRIEGSNNLLILYEAYKVLDQGNFTYFSLILQPTEWYTFKQTAILTKALQTANPTYYITLVTSKGSVVEVQSKDSQTPIDIMDYRDFTQVETVEISMYVIHRIKVNNLSLHHGVGQVSKSCDELPTSTPGIEMLIFTSRDAYGCHNKLGVTVFSYSPQSSYAHTNPPVLNDSRTQDASEACLKRRVNQATAVIVSVTVVTFLLVVILVSVTVIIVALMKPRVLFQKPDPPPEDFEYDIFLSFADQDKALVKEILYTPLTKCGYKVFWHLSDFIAGLTIAENMLTAVRQSRWIIFACSEHFERSEFCQQELRFGLNNHYSTYKGKYRRVIPLVLQEGSCPQKLKQLYPVKFIMKKSHRMKNKEIKDLIKKLNFGKPLAVLKELSHRENNRVVSEDSIHLLSTASEV